MAKGITFYDLIRINYLLKPTYNLDKNSDNIRPSTIDKRPANKRIFYKKHFYRVGKINLAVPNTAALQSISTKQTC